MCGVVGLICNFVCQPFVVVLLFPLLSKENHSSQATNATLPATLDGIFISIGSVFGCGALFFFLRLLKKNECSASDVDEN